MPVQDNEDKRTPEQIYPDAEEEIRRKQAHEQQQDESSVQKSGKLLPFLNAKAEFHQSRIDSIDEKIVNQMDRIERNKAKVDVLEDKASRLEDRNRMLKATLGNIPVVKLMIESNEKRIRSIHEEKIPKREQKIDQAWKKIDALTEKRNKIEHKLDRVVALSDAIKSFSIRFDKERREIFTDAMDRLNAANSECLIDKIHVLQEKKAQLFETYNDLNTSAVDKFNLQKKIDSVTSKIDSLEEKLHKLARPEHHFAEQSNDVVDATMQITSEVLADMDSYAEVGLTELSETIFLSAEKVEGIDKSEIARIADKFNPLKNAEMELEDDANMIDGIINNGSKEELLKSQKELSETLDAMKDIVGNKYMMQSVREGVAEDMPKIEAQLNAVTAALERLEHPTMEEVSIPEEIFMDSENWLSNMVADGKAEILADGGFKVNAEYYKELPRNDRHIETMTEAQAVEVMSALTAAGIEFSAATKGDDRVGITVSKEDVSALNDVMYSAIGKIAHTEAARENAGTGEKGKYQTVNPEYYASLDKEQRHTRVEPKDTARAIVSKLQESNIPYSAVLRKNDTVAITVSQDNAQAYQQIENAVKGSRAVEFVNPEFFKALPKQERYTERMDEGQARKKSAELTAKGVEHSAVFGGEKSAVTVAKKNRAFFSRSRMKKDAQRISGQKRQTDERQQTQKKKNQGLE